MSFKGLPLTRIFWFTLLGAFLLVFPYMHSWPGFENYISEYRTFNMTMFGVWLLVVLGINLLTGYSGQISLGHAAAVLVGAYTAGILFSQYSMPLALAVLLAAGFTGLLGGIVIGLPAVRLRGPYLAIATFAMVVSLPQILKIKKLTRWTHGATGVRVRELQPPGWFDFLDHTQWLYYTTMFSAIVMTVLFWNLTRSRTGRAMIALRDSEIAAEQMGINVPLYKALAFGISALYAGVAGGLFFQAQAFVGTESLGFLDSVLFLVAIVIGGLGTILGSVIGALFLTFQAELINKLGHVVSEAQRLRGVIYGGLLIVTILAFPRGLAWFIQGLLGERRMDFSALERARERLLASLRLRGQRD
jgi:branched-chain amino acid transport system permease protein